MSHEMTASIIDTAANTTASGIDNGHTSGRRRLPPTVVTYEVEQQIRLTLHAYCDAIDNADFEAFAAIFERGRWGMVEQSGSHPVRDWLSKHVVLHDGRTYTRHEISNLSVRPGALSSEVNFSCYIAIWQDLPGQEPRLMVHGRFDGSFQRTGFTWWWSTHSITPNYMGELSGHLKDLA